ncbi:hypothetical protein PMIN02_008721 [Paraphaeosphaeria minitans]
MKLHRYFCVAFATRCIGGIIASRKSTLSAEAQDLFDWFMHVQDNRYDSSYNFIAYPDKGGWSIRFTAWYLAGLLRRNKGDDLQRAKIAIRNIIACQMTNDFTAPWYGTYKLSPDQPDPTANSTMYQPEIYATYDPNWREFVGTQLVQVVEDFGHLSGNQLVEKIEDSLEIAAIGGMRRNGTFPQDDNLGIYYSNPAIMRALVAGWIGTRRNNTKLLDFAIDQGTKLLKLFQLNGANTLSEYNSPGYYGIDTWALGAHLKYGPKDQTMTSSAKIILREMWTDLADHYNGCLGDMVGPYDRAYTQDMSQHSTALVNFFWGLFGHAASPLPHKLESDLTFDVAQGAPIALIVEEVKSAIPTHVQDALRLRGTFQGPARSIKKTVYDDLEGKQPRVATSWISRELMIGGQSVNETVNRGDQFVPAIVHWPGDKAHEPFPLTHFSACIQAQAPLTLLQRPII